MESIYSFGFEPRVHTLSGNQKIKTLLIINFKF